MIVNNTNSGWQIIFQKAHGLLAAAIAQHWKVAQRPQRWMETLIAIADHDDNQHRWSGKFHLTAQGAPQDFSLKRCDLQQAQSITSSAKFKSSWIALLISKHVDYLYKEEKDKDIRGFLKEEQVFRKETLSKNKISQEALDGAYNLLHWCDRCSLILCKGQIPPDEKALEIFSGPEQEEYYISQRNNDKSVKVVPWPFEPDEFKISLETRFLASLTFKSDEELKNAIERSEIDAIEWHFRK